MAAMFGQCLSAVTQCLYGEGGDWPGAGGVPVIPASQRIPEVILDTTTMGHEAVVVKNGLRLCGTGATLSGFDSFEEADNHWRTWCEEQLVLLEL